MGLKCVIFSVLFKCRYQDCWKFANGVTHPDHVQRHTTATTPRGIRHVGGKNRTGGLHDLEQDLKASALRIHYIWHRQTQGIYTHIHNVLLKSMKAFVDICMFTENIFHYYIQQAYIHYQQSSLHRNGTPNPVSKKDPRPNLTSSLPSLLQTSPTTLLVSVTDYASASFIFSHFIAL